MVAETQHYFKKVIEKIKFNFIAVIDTEKNSIFGYKIIKDFSDLGFEDKDEMYQMAYDEGFFEFFVLKLQEKAYKLALEKGLNNKKLFYTLRVNFVKDMDFFFRSIESLVNKFNLSYEQLVFEIKGISNWQQFSEVMDYIDEGYECLIKENNTYPLNFQMIDLVEPNLIEIKNLDTLKLLKKSLSIHSKILYKQPKKGKHSITYLHNLGINYIYEY